MWAAELLLIDVIANVAMMRPAIQSSTYYIHEASLAVDGNLYTWSCTLMMTTEPFWSVDLGTQMDVARVCVINDDNPSFCQFGQIHF